MSERRTQAERREATQASLLAAARRFFGEKSYAETSLEDIAAACNITVRPIYHYYKSKLGLFRAVTEEIERESIENMQNRDDADIEDIWSGFMANCEDSHYRQIILIDGPALLGRSRMTEGAMALAARKESAKVMNRRPDGLTMSLLFGALSSAALYIAENGADKEDYARIRELVEFHSRKKI